MNSNLGAKFEKNEKGNCIVVVTKKQDFETPAMKMYTMTIAIAEETHKIKIAVINNDDNPPVIQPNERNCSVHENYEGLTNCTFTITDVDGWINKTTFNITSMPISGSDYFSVDPKTIPDTQLKMNATLSVIKSLDFESIAVYTLGITATDSGNNTTNNLVNVVRIIDMPDMPPVWTSLTSAITIREKSTNTLSVSAIDGDYEISASINYKIEVTEENDEKIFEVEKETGVITINEIDRDTLKKEIFKFTVIDYEVENITSSINSTIVVVVNDINDHIPEISPSDLSMDILEETYMNLNYSKQIVITDPDLAENAQYDVKLEADLKHNWHLAFLIIPNNGYQLGNFTISVVNAALLDYEDENWRNINIKIVATERAKFTHIGMRDVKINLINWNDELPVFENDNMLVNVAEDVEKGFPVAKVLAKDRDVNDTVRLFAFMMKILFQVKTKIEAKDPDTEAELKFSIDWDSSTAYKSSSPVNESFYREHLIIETMYPEGTKEYAKALLFVNGRIDYEEFDVMYLTVVVTDVTTVHNEDSVLSSLTLLINDINDNPPEFEKPEEMSVLENQKSGILIGKITALDFDGPGNNDVIYLIIPINGTKNELVQIDPKTGIIKVDEHAKIEAEAYEYLYYNVSATDSVHNTILAIEIYVIDENDEFPTIPPDRFNSTIRIKEKSENGTEVVPVHAIDKDRTYVYCQSLLLKAKIVVYLNSPTPTTDGHMCRVAKDLQKTKFDYNGNPKQKTATQNQKIIFISTEGPEFTKNTFNAEFHENTTGLKEFIIIPLAYYIINKGIQDNSNGDMSYFELDKETRNLTLKKQLDREEKDTMSIIVVATTNHNGPTSNPREKANLNITITVLDVNDNPPKFENKNYFGGAALEDAVAKVVLTVKATDADLNDSLSYSIIDKSLNISHNSLEGISVPFKLKTSAGELLLDFKITSYVTGYFSFDISVQDMLILVLHEDKTHVKVYIIAQNNRVTFTFKNKITYLNDNRSYATSNFICRADSDLETITNLKASLLTKNLYLVDVPATSSITATEDLHDVIQWHMTLLMTEKLDKLAITNYSSHNSGLDKIGILPNSNKFSLEGSNPMWKTEPVNVVEDNISRGSGDSDLIGIEDNPDFDYDENPRAIKNGKLNTFVLPNDSTAFPVENTTHTCDPHTRKCTTRFAELKNMIKDDESIESVHDLIIKESVRIMLRLLANTIAMPLSH
ncbi:LOW QUALITY PROTEIN: cadherin-23-like [Belonocnema kinseyi]|uniref:LOW QUALITY PROTEIN: cadherin-23-like n=1 Tax=Belonocnema kinseyi TaxID=2817044 RepID=UPI00143D8D26|nr:LOW QUALITY PROTEIN: cadherin-23-like [Belonocnema kinseyi]